MRYIYFLKDSITNEIRYVGQTDNIKRRYNTHLQKAINKDSSEYNTYKSRWIRKLLESNTSPMIEIIEECIDLESSNLREKYWIEDLIKNGSQLTNSHCGDVTPHSIETKNKMSVSKKGKKLEEIVGIDKSKELKKYYSERMKSNNPNKCDDPYVREKISLSLKSHFNDKSNHWAYGKKMDEDHCEKLRISKLNSSKNKGNKKPRTEEQKSKMREAILGRTVKRFHILQYDLNKNLISEWKSMRSIQKIEPSFNRLKISECCNGKRQSYAGFIWQYKD